MKIAEETRRALLLIDIQNDYFPGGRMELVNSEAAGDKARLLLDKFRQKALPVIHIQHVASEPEMGFFLPGTAGVEINEKVKPLAGETVIQKHYPSAFRETSLLQHLRAKGIGELNLAGMMTHMCVDTTVRAACDLGFACILAHDACATMELSFAGKTVTAQNVQSAYLASLDGIFAQVLDVEAVCRRLD